MILYLVVLLSGISILLRKDKPGNTEKKAVQSVPFYLVLGAVTGAVCAASGAGGPVLVMPILTLLGIPAYTAVGISLFDSIFIAVPSAAGYLIAAAGIKKSSCFCRYSWSHMASVSLPEAKMQRKSTRRC